MDRQSFSSFPCWGSRTLEAGRQKNHTSIDRLLGKWGGGHIPPTLTSTWTCELDRVQVPAGVASRSQASSTENALTTLGRSNLPLPRRGSGSDVQTT